MLGTLNEVNTAPSNNQPGRRRPFLSLFLLSGPCLKAPFGLLGALISCPLSSTFSLLSLYPRFFVLPQPPLIFTIPVPRYRHWLFFFLIHLIGGFFFSFFFFAFTVLILAVLVCHRLALSMSLSSLLSLVPRFGGLGSIHPPCIHPTSQ